MLPACSALPHARIAPREASPDRNGEIHVISHGWHTGVIVPGHVAEKNMPFLQEHFQNAKTCEFGWGDKGFYMADKITTKIALKAMFMADGSVVHVVALHDDIKKEFPHSRKALLAFSEIELDSLCGYLGSSFHRDASGRVGLLKKGLYGDIQFYEGVGRYHIMNTCNKWTAKALLSGGCDISPFAKLTASSVMSWAQKQDVR